MADDGELPWNAARRVLLIDAARRSRCDGWTSPREGDGHGFKSTDLDRSARPAPPRRLTYASRSRRWSPTRSAFAMMVSPGFTAPEDGKKLASTTYRLSTSCALQLRSSADASGSVPNRIVPFW